MTEEQLQKQVVTYLKAALPFRDCLWFHVPNGEKRHVITATKLKAMGTIPGVPDLIFLRRTEPFGIELKVGKNGLSKGQKEMRAIFEGLDLPYHVCRSLDEVLSVLECAQIPLKARKL